MGDSEGTLYFEGSYFGGITNYITLSDGTNANRVFIRLRKGLSAEYGLINSGGGSATGNFSGAASAGVNYKIAISYASNDIRVYLNGSEVANETSVNIFSNGTLTDLRLDEGDGGGNFYGNVKDLAVSDTALTDVQLAEITTL